MPRLVPVAVETRAQTKKDATTKPTGPSPAFAANQTTEVTKPPSWSTWASNPASSQARIIRPTIGWLMPCVAAVA